MSEGKTKKSKSSDLNEGGKIKKKLHSKKDKKENRRKRSLVASLQQIARKNPIQSIQKNDFDPDSTISQLKDENSKKARKYDSASDSDDTDTERKKSRLETTIQNKSASSKPAALKEPILKQHSPKSGSEHKDTTRKKQSKPLNSQHLNRPPHSTDQKEAVSKLQLEAKIPQIRKRTNKQKPSRSPPKQYDSASDSDDTDTENAQNQSRLPKQKTQTIERHDLVRENEKPQVKSVRSKEPLEKSRTPLQNNSAFYRTNEFIDSDESSNERDNEPNDKPSSISRNDSSHDSSDDSSEKPGDRVNDEAGEIDYGMFVYRKQIKRDLSSNRISNRKKKEYDESLTAAENYKMKASDAFLPTVHRDFFVSDSESDTDSGDDYDPDSFPIWQKGIRNKPPKEAEWPKARSFGYSDNLKLEKRIKKICRRKKMSFEEAQEILSSDTPTAYLEFYQKIARPFPNVSLKTIVGHCRTTYSRNKDKKGWTKEEVQKLNDLVEIYGKVPKVLSKHLDRTPNDISNFMSKHSKIENSKVVSGRWTKEEDQLLAKAVSEQICKGDKNPQFIKIEKLFNGRRTRIQIKNRYVSIRHLIQPDGSLIENRKSTVVDELEFLEKLKKQTLKDELVEESQLNMKKDSGFVSPKFYYIQRSKIPGFEKMKLLDILNILIDKQKRVIESRKEEGLL